MTCLCMCVCSIWTRSTCPLAVVSSSVCGTAAHGLRSRSRRSTCWSFTCADTPARSHTDARSVGHSRHLAVSPLWCLWLGSCLWDVLWDLVSRETKTMAFIRRQFETDNLPELCGCSGSRLSRQRDYIDIDEFVCLEPCPLMRQFNSC